LVPFFPLSFLKKLYPYTIRLRETGFSEGREYRRRIAVQRLLWGSTGQIVTNDADEIVIH
jgi:hypothetical protein